MVQLAQAYVVEVVSILGGFAVRVPFLLLRHTIRNFTRIKHTHHRIHCGNANQCELSRWMGAEEMKEHCDATSARVIVGDNITGELQGLAGLRRNVKCANIQDCLGLEL